MVPPGPPIAPQDSPKAIGCGLCLPAVGTRIIISADPLWVRACRCGLSYSNKLRLIDPVYKLLVAKSGITFGNLEPPEG